MRRLVGATVLALAGIALAAPLARAADPPYVPGEVLARFVGEPQVRTVELAAGVTVPEGVRDLRADPDVAYANPDYLASGSALWDPNDPGTNGLGWSFDQWNFLAPTSLNLGGASVQGAWQNLRNTAHPGGRGVTVAVLDTGIAYRSKGTQYIRDPDLPPTTRFVNPKDFVDGDEAPLDENGHGTHVASTIVQSTDNARGLTGVAYGATVIPVRVLNRQEIGTAGNIARGIRYAMDHGADVINLSLQFKSVVNQCSKIPSVCTAIKAAATRGVVVVAAAGNGHQPKVAYPARAPGVIAVGGTTYTGCLGAYSNYGAGLDLVAPGGGMDTADPTLNPSCDTTQPGYAIRQFSLVPQAAAAGNYRKFGFVGLHGTSMAAAHVSATAALLLARRPHFSPAQVEGRLEACASLPGQATFYGKGLLDAAKATSTNSC